MKINTMFVAVAALAAAVLSFTPYEAGAAQGVEQLSDSADIIPAQPHSGVQVVNPGSNIGEVAYEGFSTDQGDYIATIYIAPKNPGEFRAVWYGKTTKSDFITFDDYYGDAFPQILLAVKDVIGDEKIVVIATNASDVSSYIPVTCKFIEGKTPSEGMEFQCVQKNPVATAGKDRDTIVDELNSNIASYSFLGAKKYNSPAVQSHKFTAADADFDGIPDAIDSCASANIYGEACPEAAEAVTAEENLEVASAADASGSDSTEVSAGDAQDDPVAADFASRFDEGGSCSMVATAAFHPTAMAVAALGLIPLLAGRRRRS